MTKRYPEALQRYQMPPDKRAARRAGIGGSDANVIMSGDATRIKALWREKRGDPLPDDPPSVNMLMGTVTEGLNADWYSYMTGDTVTDTQRVFLSDAGGYPAACTVDGICLSGSAIWEAKHTSRFDFQSKSKKDIGFMVERYYPQLQHNMMVSGLRRAVLSVLFDNTGWDYAVIEADPFYQDTLREAERSFWESVQSGSRFEVAADGARSTGDDPKRIVDMTGNNAWAAAAADYYKHKDAAGLYEAAQAKLKGLVDPDVAQATGYGVKVTRDKRGAMRIYAV